MINTINYITTDSWWDTDVTILRQIKDKYKVNVLSLISNPREYL